MGADGDLVSRAVGVEPTLRMRHVVFAAGVLASGCAQFEPGSDMLEAETAANLPRATSAEWACLDAGTSGAAPEPVVANTVERVVISLQVVDLSSGQTYSDAALRACGITDINCESPILDGLFVDERGWVDIPLFAGFTGYLEITSPTMAPVLFYYVDPLPPRSIVEYPLAVVARASLQPLVQLLGVDFDPNVGVQAFRAFDCTGAPAAGVSFTLEGNAVPWYFAGRLPNGMASATDPEGIGGFVSVQPGLTVIEAMAPDGRSMAGPLNLLTRPGWVSVTFVRPRGTSAP